MVENVVSFLLEQLSVVLHDERKLFERFKHDVQSIYDELLQMKEFLIVDADEESDNGIKEWIGQLQEIAYDFEEVLDDYILQFGRHRNKDELSDCLKRVGALIKNWRARHEIASEIKTIRHRLGNVAKCSEKHKNMDAKMDQGSSSIVPNDEKYDSRRSDHALFVEDDDVVGIEESKEQLHKWIWSKKSGLEVISVVGTCGLGKTTLAKKVYESVKGYFDQHVWVVVSDYKDNVKALLENVIKKLIGEVTESPPQGIEDMNIDDMRCFIYEILNKRKYIIVLDDVRKLTTWDAIRSALPRKGCHGCIIITTRFNNIGDGVCSKTGHVYNLNPLSQEQSEKLFFKRVFPRSPCPPYLREFVENILSICEGSPLAIVLIGGLLARKKNKKEEWELFNRSLSHEFKGESLERLWKLFSLIYNDLPYHLKHCFMYLSIFPEGSLLKKERILRLWTVEGFVLSQQDRCLDEVAEVYLDDLCSRSLLQVAETHIDGRARAFCIHDLLREYITSKTGELNVAIIHKGDEAQWPNKIRRLAIHNSANLFVETNKFEHLRSLMLCNGDTEIGTIKEILRRCRLLKVLDLGGAPIECIPDEIFKLHHLKYLCLRDTMVDFIPKSIKHLQNLETLDLKNTNVIELPVEILQLRRLRHLIVYRYKIDDMYAYGAIQSFRAPYKIGSLVYLQKLNFIDADADEVVSEIGKLTQLRRLGIEKLRREDGEKLCFSIAKLTNLRSLSIASVEEGEMLELDYSLSSTGLPFLRTLCLYGHLEKVPRWISSLHALSVLSLRWSKLREDPLNYIEDLPNLTSLLIQDAEVEGLSFKARKFQKLKELYLYELRRMKWVRVEEDSMLALEEWGMCGCELLRELPQGIEYLNNLQYLQFNDMSDEFKKSVGRSS